RDVSSNQLDGTTFNMPARGMTGHRWDATAQSPSAAPEQYSAIHFHSDDFEDAAWQPDFEVRIPPDLDSGAYLVRLSGNRDASFDVPFFVIPPARSSKSIVVVMPTFAYLAYGNDHLWGRTDIEHGVLWPADRFENPDPADTYLAAHRDLGLALYGRHVDGSGSMYASRLRPLVN